MLSRLQEVIATSQEAYAAYDFRKVFQALNQFVTVDISALYIDITKDRMYCDAANSPRRIATQTVMQRVFEALTRLLAPMLAFTADEAWEFSGRTTSVHLETFPEANASLRDTALEAEIAEWLKLRGVIAQSVEPARQQKLVGNALEAAVTTLEIGDAKLLGIAARACTAGVEEFFILASDLTLVAGPETKSNLVRTPYKKCARCWRHRAPMWALAPRILNFAIAAKRWSARCNEIPALSHAPALRARPAHKMAGGASYRAGI